MTLTLTNQTLHVILNLLLHSTQ